MKFTIKLFSLLLGCSFAFGISVTTVPTTVKDISIYEYKENINKQYDTVRSKVRFEGIGSVLNESNSQIADMLNQDDTYTMDFCAYTYFIS